RGSGPFELGIVYWSRIIGTIMTRTQQRRPNRKAKKSYTLSPESVQFLEAMRKRSHAPSTSSVLEEILQAVRHQQQIATVEQAVADYYSSLSLREAEEHATWGEFALREFPGEGA